MFIKIKNWIGKRNEDKTFIYDTLDREVVCDCVRYSIGPDEKEYPKEIFLVIDIGEQDERTFWFPIESETICTEVYVMNNDGKTIDKYIY